VPFLLTEGRKGEYLEEGLNTTGRTGGNLHDASYRCSSAVLLGVDAIDKSLFPKRASFSSPYTTIDNISTGGH
jgi:hypothetical protein